MSDRSPDEAVLATVIAPHSRWRQAPLIRAALLLFLICSVVATMQRWVGTYTIYDQANQTKRLALHRYILENRLPPGTEWRDLGANGTNVRIGTVYLAEALHRAFAITLIHAYLLIDYIALTGSLVLLFVYLARWFSVPYALIGLLYFASVLPLTYVLGYFHPWDRLSLLLWIVLLLLLRAGRTGWFGLVLLVSVIVKFDTVPLPGLYWLVRVTRLNWQRVTTVAAALSVCSLGTLVGLRLLRPGGFHPVDRIALASHNLEAFRSNWFAYPPALAFVVPAVLSAIGFRSSDRFMRACVWFAVLLIGIFLVDSNFAEFRAQVPVLVLLLPSALRGVQVLGMDRVMPSALAGPAEQ